MHLTDEDIGALPWLLLSAGYTSFKGMKLVMTTGITGSIKKRVQGPQKKLSAWKIRFLGGEGMVGPHPTQHRASCRLGVITPVRGLGPIRCWELTRVGHVCGKCLDPALPSLAPARISDTPGAGMTQGTFPFPSTMRGGCGNSTFLTPPSPMPVPQKLFTLGNKFESLWASAQLTTPAAVQDG